MTTPDDYFPAVGRHYTRGDLGERILEALRSQGKDLDALTADDIAPLTHLTGRPKVATVELGRRAGLQPHWEVLDLGSGLGGPARTLATEFGCRVTGLDLTDEFVRTAAMLTARVGLDDRITFREGTRWRCRSRTPPSTWCGTSSSPCTSRTRSGCIARSTASCDRGGG